MKHDKGTKTAKAGKTTKATKTSKVEKLALGEHRQSSCGLQLDTPCGKPRFAGSPALLSRAEEPIPTTDEPTN